MHKKKLLLIGVAVAMVVLTAGAFFIQNQTAKPSKDPNAPIRVACVGDSLTEGSAYPDDLWMLLGANYTVGSFGYGGTTVSLDSATPYMQEAVFEEAKEFQPDIVVIMLGSNDAHPGVQMYNSFFVSDYLKLIGEFQALKSKPDVWLVLPPPILHNGTGLSTEFFEQNIIPAIKQTADKASVPLIDVHRALAARPDCFPVDGVHPTDEGAQLIADEVYKALISKSP